jgi:general secretion pathway protein D
VPSATGPRLLLTPPGSQVALGAAVNVTLRAENVEDLFTASPVRIKWDPKVLRLNEITPGDLLSRDGQRVTTAKDIRNDAGEAWVTMNRLPGAGGVSGTGSLGLLSFTAIGKGQTKITVTEFGLKNTQLQPVPVTGPEADVTVQ